MEVKNEDRKEDEDDDEFEDESELEGCKFGMRTADERRRRDPLIIPIPILRRTSMSLQEKIEIIKELSNGAKQSWICKIKRLPKSTVQSIWKNRQKILGYVEAVEKIGPLSRKRCRKAQHEDVETKLVEWIDAFKSQNVSVNGPQLRAKAQVFAKQMGITQFRSSTGWLDKFKTRHNIVFKKSVKQGLAADKKVALDWVTKIWPKNCDGYLPENIFSLGEFGLYWNALPDQTIELSNDTCSDGKLAEDRLTVLCLANADGSEKRKLTVVGCYKLSGVTNLNNLPVKYVQDSKSWLSKLQFSVELRQWDNELRMMGRNVLLVLANSPVHTVTESFSNIKLVFLPPIVANIIHPLDHGVIQIVKSQYRRLFLDNVARKYQHEISKSRDSLNVSLMEALGMLDSAWIDVKPRLITDCFKTSNLQSVAVTSSYKNEDCTEISRHQNYVTFDLELMERALDAGIPILADMRFSKYVDIDSRLQVTNYKYEHEVVNNTILGSNQNELICRVIATSNNNNADIPTKPDVQNYLLSIRNWISSLPSDIDRSVHQSIGVLENFALQQLHEQQYQNCEYGSTLININEEPYQNCGYDSTLININEQQYQNCEFDATLINII